MSKKQKNRYEDKIAKHFDGPSVARGASSEDTPSFSFQYICTGKFCIKKCSIEQFRSLSDKLRILSNMEWKKIDYSPREQHGYEPLPVSSLKSSLPGPFASESTVYVFRIANQKGRFAGIRRKNVFFVLFVESTFNTLYDHT